MSDIFGKWCLSRNGEDYDEYEFFDTKQEAIAYAKKNEDYSNLNYMYVGKAFQDFHPSIDVDSILETLSDEAYDTSPDWGDTYLEDVQKNHKEELGKNLNDVLSKWIEKYNYQPNFFAVKESEKFELREDNNND